MRYSGYRGDNLTPVMVLIVLSFLVYVATKAATLLDYPLIVLLGLQPAALLARPWTIITNLFVHGSIWHLLANMFTLFFFGNYLHQLVGEKRFLITYFGGGILGSILFLLLGSPYSIAVGASGAVFALAGALAVMRPRLRVFIMPIPVPVPIWVAVLGGVIILSFFSGIAWQAHLGGVIFGLVAGYIFRRRERRYYYRR